MNLTEQYDGIIFLTIMASAEQTQNWETEKIIDALSRSTDKPRVEYWEGQYETMIYIRAVQGHSHGAKINPTLFSLKEIPLNWKEPIFHTGSSYNCQPILETIGKRIKFEKYERILFLSTSESARFVIETADDRLDRTVHEPRTVLYRQSNRPDHDCIYYFNLRRAQDAYLVFHQGSSDAIILNDNMRASALDKVVTFAGDVFFERKPSTFTKPEATLGDRIDLRISDQPEEP